MTNGELLEGIRAALREALGGAGGTIRAHASVNRGVCAGSVSYATRPTRRVDIGEVMCLVREAYAANDCTIDLKTDAGSELFGRIFLEAVKEFVGKNMVVDLVGRLRFEPRVYAGRPGAAWMCPVACNAEFNRLPSEVDVAQSPSFIRRHRAAARKRPYDAAGTAVAHSGHVTCPACGTKIRITEGAGA